MSWMNQNQNPNKLLQKSFVIGLTGILLCLIPMAAILFPAVPAEQLFFLNGFGILAQLLALSMAVFVLRIRKIADEPKQKAKHMIVVLGAAILFFFLN